MRIIAGAGQTNVLLGMEGVITSRGPFRILAGAVVEWEVRLDAIDVPKGFLSDELAPLTDPKADEFIASVKSWGPLQPQTITAQLEESLLMVRGGSQ